MLINQRLEEPYNKLPRDGELPILSQTLVNCQLTPRFWSVAKSILDTNLINNIYFNDSNNIINNNKVSNNNSKTNYNKMNCIQKNKRSKTPLLSNNKSQFVRNDFINVYNDYNIEQNNFNYYNKYKFRNNEINKNKEVQDSFENINIDNIELSELKEMAEKLEKDINKKEIIILKQKKEKTNLIQKVEKLEELVSSLITMNNL